MKSGEREAGRGWFCLDKTLLLPFFDLTTSLNVDALSHVALPLYTVLSGDGKWLVRTDGLNSCKVGFYEAV